MEESIELIGEPALAGAGHIIHELVHEDEGRGVFWQEFPDNIPGGSCQFFLVLLENF